MEKMTKTPFKGFVGRASELLEIVHTYVYGPMSIPACGGFFYFITFNDDLRRYGYIYLMKNKSKTFERFKEFHNEAKNQRGKKIKFLRSDHGREYLSHEFSEHLKGCRIVPQLNPPGMPQCNGVFDRHN
jgi:transposase InsO family protein